MSDILSAEVHFLDSPVPKQSKISVFSCQVQFQKIFNLQNEGYLQFAELICVHRLCDFQHVELHQSGLLDLRMIPFYLECFRMCIKIMI